MLKFDSQGNTFERVSDSNLKEENILERYNLQKAIVNSWSDFAKELGLPEAILIGEAIKVHPSVQNELDVLAFDPNDSSFVVIELKRDKDKLQLLQALSYAAMVAVWDDESISQILDQGGSSDTNELKSLIEATDKTRVKIILIAESFDPEVIITADWLYSNYSVDISAFALSLNKHEDQLLVQIDQRYPLKELSDSYESRSRRQKKINKSDITWDQVRDKLTYPYKDEIIEKLIRIKPGDPGRRRFIHIRSHFKSFDKVSIHLREKYINVYLTGKPDGYKSLILDNFTDKPELNEWARGYTLNVKNQSQYDDLVKWLEL